MFLGRLLLMVWYLLWGGQVLPVGAVLLESLHQEHGLSETCSGHSCLCSIKGYCDEQCCCRGDQESAVEDEPGLVSCGWQKDLHQRALSPIWHIKPEDHQPQFIIHESRSFQGQRLTWKNRVLDPPEKVPLVFL